MNQISNILGATPGSIDLDYPKDKSMYIFLGERIERKLDDKRRIILPQKIVKQLPYPNNSRLKIIYFIGSNHTGEEKRRKVLGYFIHPSLFQIMAEEIKKNPLEEDDTFFNRACDLEINPKNRVLLPPLFSGIEKIILNPQGDNIELLSCCS